MGIVVRSIEDVSVEGVEGFGTELESYALGDESPLDQAEVFFEIAEGAVVGLICRFVAEGIGGCSCDVGVGIANASGVVPEVRSGDCRVERSVPSGSGTQALSRHEVVAYAVVVSGNSSCAAEAQGLATLVSLDATDRPSADEVVEGAALAQEGLVLAKGQVIDVADDEDLRRVLRGDGFLCFKVERVLDAGGVGAAEAATDDVAGIGEDLGPGVGG